LPLGFPDRGAGSGIGFAAKGDSARLKFRAHRPLNDQCARNRERANFPSWSFVVMNGTVLPAWLHSIVFAVLSAYMFMLWAGLKRDSLSEAQKRLVERIEVLRSPGAALSGGFLFLALAVGNAVWAYGYRW